MENLLTITGINYYYEDKPFKIGKVVRLRKDKQNTIDDEAIAVDLPFVGVIGYVANSVNTVYRGTQSAGRIYDKIKDTAYAEIIVITHSSVIIRVLPEYEYSKYDNLFDFEVIELIKE